MLLLAVGTVALLSFSAGGDVPMPPGGNDVPVGTIYAVGTYARALTPEEIALLHAVYTRQVSSPAL